MMEKRVGERNERIAQRQAMRLLSKSIAHCSAWLCASILTAEEYPSLGERMEMLAEREAKSVRALGRMMLREGWNFPVSRLLQTGRGQCPALFTAKGRDLRAFLGQMQKESEGMERELEELFSVCQWDGEQTSLLRENGQCRLEEIKQMLS